MQIVRVRNPEGVDEVKKHFLEESDWTPEHTAKQLKELLLADPEACCFLAAVEKEEIVGFMISVAAPGQSHVFVLQAWAGPGFPVKDRDRMFIRTCTWAESLGRKGLRMETKRPEAAWERRWGFVHHSTIMSFDIPDDMDFSFLRGNNNGRKLESEKHEHPERRTDEDLAGDQGISGGKDRSGSRDLLRDAGGSADSPASEQLELFDSGDVDS
jgi:hypothetical protein